MKSLLDRDDLIFDPPRSGCVLSLTGLPGGDGKIYDRSPYGNIGTITGATWVMLPTGLWCLSFDGIDDYVDFGSGASLRPTSALTIKTWVNFAARSGWDTIVCYEGEIYELHIGGDTFCFNLTTTISGAATLSSGRTATLATWFHVACTFDSSLTSNQKKIYVNGVRRNEANATGAIDYGANDTLHLGTIPPATNDADALIALTEIHNRPWTALDVQTGFDREKHLFGVW